METYLLKFSACLFVFWVVYILFLERQNMHLFKRFYLLAAFIIALVIPNLTITEYIEPVVTDFEMAPSFIPTEFVEITPVDTPSIFTLVNILWFIYGVGALLFALRFIVNLINMRRRISKNKQISTPSFIYVLLNEDLIPHSFFRYIFFNKARFESNNIPQEVLLHEETHAKQLHSIDIIVLEVLQIVFWFHPLIYILKHHVKLNHEFLADQAVLNQCSDAKVYQNILLQFSSNTQNHQLASAINYSSIKKRFTVMKTQTSKTRIWLSTILVLPLIAVLFYSFAEKEYVEKEFTETSEALLGQNLNTINIIINKNEEFLINNKIGSLKSLELLLKKLPVSDYTVSLKTDRETSMALTKTVLELLTNYNVFTSSINIDEQTKERILSYENPNSVKYYNKQYNTYEALRAKDPHYIYKSKEEQIKMEELFSELGTLYFDMSKENKAKVKRPKSYMSPYVKVSLNGKIYFKKYDELTEEEKATLPPPPPPASKKTKGGPNASDNVYKSQEKATAKQVAEYNSWAKRLNASENKIIKRKELIKYTHIYNIMSSEQKKTSAAFPEIPPAPPVPPKPNKSSDKGGPNLGNHQLSNNEKSIKAVEVLIKKDNSILLNKKPIKIEGLTNGVNKVNNHLTKEERRNYVSVSVIVENNNSLDFFKKVQSELNKASILTITINYKENREKNGLPTKHNGLFSGLSIEEAKKQKEKFLKENNSQDLLNKKIDSLNSLTPNSNPWSVKTEVTYIKDSEKKENILPIVNGKTIKSGEMAMTFTELKKLTLSLPEGEITAFKLKIPGIKTEQINGNKITQITLKNLESAKLGDYITIFDIKDDNSSKFSPLAIVIVE